MSKSAELSARLESIRGASHAYLAINVESASDADLGAVVAGEVPTHADVVRMAALTLEARASRLTGDISRALRLEGKVDRLYETLPAHFRY